MCIADIAAIVLVLASATGVSARADQTETLFDGRNVADWSTRRDAGRLAAEFSVSEVTKTADGSALSWRFVSRGVAFNDLFLERAIGAPFRAIRVRVRNSGAPVTLACKAADASGAEWTANRVEMPSGGAWRWAEFPVASWQPASWSHDADGRLDFPLAFFTLICFDVRPGETYHLEISRIEIVRPDPPIVRVDRFSIPRALRHGGMYRCSLRFRISKPCLTDGAWLVFRRGGKVAFRTPLPLKTPPTKLAPGQVVDLPDVQLRVPEFAWGGAHEVSLEVGNARAIRQGGSEDVMARTNIAARKPGATTATVKPHNGTPMLFINGRPHNGMMYTAYGPSVEVFRDFAGAGIDLFSFSATPTESGYGLARTAWTAPGVYDFSQLDERVQMVLEANPNAYFFPRLYVHAPKWWSEQHPDDIVLMDPGDGKPVPFVHSGGKPAPSWASETWRRDTIEGLRRLIAHVEASPYADRCIGYHIASGTTEEWMMWGANEDEWVDYSPVNLARFRRWLRMRYGTDAGLRNAWSDPSVTIGTAAIPTKRQRMESKLGALRDPASEQPSVDFALYHSDLVADTINTLCGAVKRITGGKKLAGAFYGYLLQLCGEQRQQNAGHLALEKVLACPDVDFLCSPTSYAFRQVGGEGTSHFMSLYGSVKLHGKLWFNENDIRTSVSGGQPGEWGRPADVAGDILQQDKESAHVLAQGAGQWWFDVGGNRYNDPALMARIRQLASAASSALDLDRTSDDEIAMVVDEGSLARLRVGDPLGSLFLLQQLPALHRVGAPVGHYLQSDLPRIADRKVLLFMASYAPTDEQRQAVNALKGNGRVLVFLGMPGCYRGGKLDESAMEAFTGIRLKLGMNPTALRLTMRGGDPITEGLDGAEFGAALQSAPVAYADDPTVTVLGTFADGRAGFVVKRHRDWTAVFCAAPLMPAPLLRRIAKLAGVHSYVDTEDVVWASSGVVSVSVKDAGERLIRLRQPSEVRDLFSGKLIAKRAAEFRAAFGALQTRAFAVRTAR